jgi:uncharacterized protein YuzE
MKTKEILILRRDGSRMRMIMPVIKINGDRYLFSREEAMQVPALYLFCHEQQHSRIDLSLLDDHLLISFDKEDHLVGITFCRQTASGPFEVHNKQRIFLLIRRDQIQEPAEIESIIYV